MCATQNKNSVELELLYIMGSTILLVLPKGPSVLSINGCSVDPGLPVPFSHCKTGLLSNPGWDYECYIHMLHTCSQGSTHQPKLDKSEGSVVCCTSSFHSYQEASYISTEFYMKFNKINDKTLNLRLNLILTSWLTYLLTYYAFRIFFNVTWVGGWDEEGLINRSDQGE